jgi:hypothetical protein
MTSDQWTKCDGAALEIASAREDAAGAADGKHQPCVGVLDIVHVAAVATYMVRKWSDKCPAKLLLTVLASTWLHVWH